MMKNLFPPPWQGRRRILVTKNKKHFPKDHPSLKIVTVKEFLREIERLRN